MVVEAYRGVATGWFDYEGVRGRWNFIGAALLQFVTGTIISAMMLPFGILSLGIAFYGIALLMLVWGSSIMTQRIRHCGLRGFWLVMMVILSYLLVLPMLIFMIWPGRE